MDTLITFLTSLGPQHWLVFGLILLIAEMASGTTYLLWPAVAAFLTALVAWTGATNWVVEIAIFAVLVIALTAFGRPIVQRWRNENKAEGLNERSKTLIGTRGVITVSALSVSTSHCGGRGARLRDFMLVEARLITCCTGRP